MKNKEVVYGMRTADGEIDANRCILTGRAVTPENSIRERIPDTKYTYRILSSQYNRVTDEMREQWRANHPDAAEIKDAAGVPDYSAMSIDDLTTLAATRGLFIVGTGTEGRVTKRDVVSALKEADNAR